MAGIDDLGTMFNLPGNSSDAIKLKMLQDQRQRDAMDQMAAMVGAGDTQGAAREGDIAKGLSSDMASNPDTGTQAMTDAAYMEPTQVALRGAKNAQAGAASVAAAQGPIAEEQAKTQGAKDIAAQQHQLEQASLTAPGGPRNPESAGNFKTDYNAKGQQSFQEIAAPQQIQMQSAHAKDALAVIPQIQAMADALDKRGLIGTAMGRLSNSATGTGPESILTSHLLGGESKLAISNWKQGLEGLKGAIAMVNAGGRGGANPALLQRFDQLLSLEQDPQALKGGIQGAQRWLTQYAHAKTPADLAAADAELGIIPTAPPAGQ